MRLKADNLNQVKSSPPYVHNFSLTILIKKMLSEGQKSSMFHVIKLINCFLFSYYYLRSELCMERTYQKNTSLTLS